MIQTKRICSQKLGMQELTTEAIFFHILGFRTNKTTLVLIRGQEIGDDIIINTNPITGNIGAASSSNMLCLLMGLNHFQRFWKNSTKA
jgi:hypothetical protein